MADKEFNVKISAETDDFSSGISKAEDEASILGDTLKSKVTSGADEATSKIKEMIEELRRLQKEAMGVKNSTSNMNGSFKESSGEANKFKREMKNLSMILGGEVPEGTKKAYSELAKLHKEARNASRLYGKYSQQAMNARDAITTFALGLDDTAFKQIYMRSQLGLTDMQLRQQANSIKLNARMTKLMGNQTQILTQRMQGLQKAGVKPEMLLPPSTIGQFKQPLSFGEEAIVETRFINSDAAKILFEYTIYRASDQNIVATGTTTQVFLNTNRELELVNPAFYIEWKKKWNII